jgi:hypothetical protein
MQRLRTLARHHCPAEEGLLDAIDRRFYEKHSKNLSHTSVPCKDGHIKEKALGLRDLHIVYKSYL